MLNRPTPRSLSDSPLIRSPPCPPARPPTHRPLQEKAGAAREGMGRAAEGAKGRASAATGDIHERASAAAEGVKEKARSAANAAADKAEEVIERMRP